MKFRGKDGETVEILWSDHQPGCKSCREVDINQSPTFVKACAMGSQLLAEELVKRQAPVEAQKRKKVRKQAEEAGTFIKSHVKDPRTKYVGD